MFRICLSPSSLLQRPLFAHGWRSISARESRYLTPRFCQVSDCKTSKVLRKMGEQSKEEGIQCMCWGRGENPEEIVVAGAASGIVNVWDVEVGFLAHINRRQTQHHR